MRKIWLKAALGIGTAALLTACATTSVLGKNNDEYTPKAERTEAATEPVTEEVVEIVLKDPDESVEIMPYYTKFRLPGVSHALFGFTNEKGETQYLAYGEIEKTKEAGFLVTQPHKEKKASQYELEIVSKKFIDHAKEKPGTPEPSDGKYNLTKLKKTWKPVPEYENLFYFEAKEGEYQFRRWAKLGELTHFFPTDDTGALILGGLPDTVEIDGQWVDILRLDPMTFAFIPPPEEEETEATEVEEETEWTEPEDEEEPAWTPPRTEEPWSPPRTEAPWTPPRTEAPQTDPPRTEPPRTEPPQTEPPQTEPPRTEAPVTEPVRTEPPEPGEEWNPVPSQPDEYTEWTEEATEWYEEYLDQTP